MVTSTKERILLCEDDPESAAGTISLLRDEFDIVVAGDKETAMHYIDKSMKFDDPRERYAVAVIDLKFFEEEVLGFDILEEVLGRDAYLECIVYTATGSEAKSSEAQQRGAFRYVIKPGGNVLRGAVRAAIGVRRSILGIQQLVANLAKADPAVLAVSRAVLNFAMALRGRLPEQS